MPTSNSYIWILSTVIFMISYFPRLHNLCNRNKVFCYTKNLYPSKMKDTDSSICILLFIAHFAKLSEHLRKLCFHCLIRKLTGSDCFMSAAIVFQHQASDIDIGGSV